MNRASVKFRGESREVEFKDYGDDTETNSHEIDWHFTEQEMSGLNLTAAEEQGVYDQLIEILRDSYDEAEYF